MKHIKYIVFIIILVVTIVLKTDNCQAYVIDDDYYRYDNNLDVQNYYEFKGEYIDDKHLELNIGFESNTYNHSVYSEPIIIYYDISPEMSKNEIIKYKAQLINIINMLDDMQIGYAVIPSGTNLSSLAISVAEANGYTVDPEDLPSPNEMLSFIASERLTDTWIEKLKNAEPSSQYKSPTSHEAMNASSYKIITISSFLQSNNYLDDDTTLNCNNNRIMNEDEFNNTSYGEFYNIQYGHKTSNNFCKNITYTDETNLYSKVASIIKRKSANMYNTRIFEFTNDFGMFEIESIDDIEISEGNITSSQITDYIWIDPEQDPTPVERTQYTITINNYDCTYKEDDDVYEYNIKIKLKLIDEYYNDSSLDNYVVYANMNSKLKYYDTYDGLEQGTDLINLNYDVYNKFDFYVNDTYKETYKIGDIVNLEDYEADFLAENNSELFLGLYVNDDIVKKITTKKFYMPGEDVYAKSIYATNEIHKYTDDYGLSELPPKATINSLYDYDLTNDNINIIFANQCWEYISDDDKGAKKLIYNGEPDDFGMCGSDRKDHTGISSRSTISIASKQDFFTDYRYNETNQKYYLTGTQTHYNTIDLDQDYDDLRGLFFCEGDLGPLNSCDQIYSVGEKTADINDAIVYAQKITNNINYDSIGNVKFNQLSNDLAGIGYMSQSGGDVSIMNLNKQRALTSRINATSGITYGTSYQVGNAVLTDPETFTESYNNNNERYCELTQLSHKFIIITYNSNQYVGFVRSTDYNPDVDPTGCSADVTIKLWRPVTPDASLPNLGEEIVIQDILNYPSFTGEYSTDYEYPVTITNENTYDPNQDNLSILDGKYIITRHTDKNNSSYFESYTISETTQKYTIEYVTDVIDNQLNVISYDIEPKSYLDNLQAHVYNYYYADSYSYDAVYNRFYLENSDNSAVQHTNNINWATDMAGSEEFYMCIGQSSCQDIIYVRQAGTNGYTYYIDSLLFGDGPAPHDELTPQLYNAENYVKQFNGPNLKYVCHDENIGMVIDDSKPFTCNVNRYMLDVQEVQTTGNSVYYGDSILRAYLVSASVDTNSLMNGILSGNNDTNIKDIIDRWYEHNLLKYSKYIVDSPFNQELCYNNVNTFNQNEHTFDQIEFLDCNDDRSVYSVSEEFGNGKLTYPIGIFSIGPTAKSESYWIGTVPIGNYYDYTNDKKNLIYYNASEDDFDIASGTENLNVRPVINITSGLGVIGGTGTTDNPYVLDDGSQFSEEYKNSLLR